jgi:pimeloyl-ACP methyl ester carboxylesterase
VPVVGRTIVVLLLAAVFACAWATSASARELTLTMDDGVPMACGFEPQPGPSPAVMLFHGLGGRHEDLAAIAAALGQAGYATLACDARGQGASGGYFDLDGPRTVQDIREEFDWLASQPGIDGAHIGAWGISLGGGAVWNSTVAGVPWAAIETVETWSDLYKALVPNGLPKTGAIFLFSQGIPERARSPELAALLQDAIAGRNLGAIKAFADARSSLAKLSQVRTPAFIFQGRKDFAFDIDQGRAAFRALPEGPKRLYVGDFGHAPSTFPGPDFEYVLAQGLAWFNQWLKGTTDGVQPAFALAPDPWSRPVANEVLPATRNLKLTLRGSATIDATGKVVRQIRLPRGRLETFGAPVVRVRVSGSFTHIVAVLENGSTLVSEGGIALRPSAKPHVISFRLISDAVRLRSRSLKLTLAAASTAQSTANLLYPNGVSAGARLKVGAVTVTLPVLRKAVSP